MDEYFLDIILISVFVLSCLYFNLQASDSFKVMPPYMPKACAKKEPNINNLIDEIDDASYVKKTIFVEANYHGDYFDILRILNSLSDNNVVFNNENANVESVSPTTDLTYIDALTKQINDMNKQDYNETVKSWGYKQQFAKRDFKWEQQLEDLGLPRVLYKDFAEPSSIDILVRKMEQNETTTQVQYVVEAVIHKKSASVNLIVKLTFVQQKGEPTANFETAHVLGYEK